MLLLKTFFHFCILNLLRVSVNAFSNASCSYEKKSMIHFRKLVHGFDATHSLTWKNLQMSTTSKRMSMKSNTEFKFPFDFSIMSSAPISKKKIAVITGTSSGLGKTCLKALVEKGDYFVVCAVRDTQKMESVSENMNLSNDTYKILKLDLASLKSVRKFALELKRFLGNRKLDALVCNAAVYQPAKSYPNWTEDGFEMQMGVNHLGHFLLVSELIPVMKSKDSRVIIVGSITGNSNSIGGGLVLPRADLGQLEGLEKGAKKPVSMVDGKAFNGAKAYKDSKVLNMMTVNELHRRYHKSTGIIFSSMYPGCIAETALFREKREWFRKLFPIFMKYVTGGYVSEDEAGERLAVVVADPLCKKSGVYWSWNGNAKQIGVLKDGVVVGAGGSGGDIFENEQSDMVKDSNRARKMFELSSKITGAKWPQPNTEIQREIDAVSQYYSHLFLTPYSKGSFSRTFEINNDPIILVISVDAIGRTIALP